MVSPCGWTGRRFCQQFRLDINTIIPETYLFQCGKPVNKKQRHDFIESYMTEEELHRMDNVWILKPSGGGKGKGIEVVRDLRLPRARHHDYLSQFQKTAMACPIAPAMIPLLRQCAARVE